jgi:transcriptional regulator with XRE-family HTH domain
MKTIDQVISRLPVQRREKIQARARELVAEETALRHLREARQLTQASMARLLGIGQDSVSRLESRSDLLLSTLKSYVEAMGGSLKLVVEFPDSGCTVLSSLGESDNNAKASSRKSAPRRSRRPALAPSE